MFPQVVSSGPFETFWFRDSLRAGRKTSPFFMSRQSLLFVKREQTSAELISQRKTLIYLYRQSFCWTANLLKESGTVI
jgi:hypothetical protein